MLIVFCCMECAFLGLHSRFIMPRHQVSDSPQPGINKNVSLYSFLKSGLWKWRGSMTRVSVSESPRSQAGLLGQPNGSCASKCPGIARGALTPWLLGNTCVISGIYSTYGKCQLRQPVIFPIGHLETHMQLVKGGSVGTGAMFSMTQSLSSAERW